MTLHRRLIPAVLVLVTLFAVATAHLTRESLWDDEGWSLWAVNAPGVGETLARVASDVHPPLYFLLLDAWISLAGESVYAVRLQSALCALVGLAATVAIGSRLFDRWTGLLAALILGTAGFTIYYAREIRMYALLLALAALATWAYLRWRESPTTRRAAAYAALMSLMLYAHYSGALIVLTHLLHALLTMRQRRTVLPFALALLAYLPWLAVLVAQAQAHDARPLALPLPTDANTIWTLVLVLTSGTPGLYALPLLVGARGLWRAGGVGLLVLWLLVTPLVLLALNASVTPVYQLRYAIAVLPAGALLLGAGLREAARMWGRVGQVGAAGLLAAVLLVQLVMYPAYWHEKSRYGQAVALMTAARKPHEPLIADIFWASATAYYDRAYGIRQGAFLDVTYQPRDTAHDRAIAQVLDAALPVWVVMPTNVSRTWDVVSALTTARGVGYRDSVMNMLFYRFDPNAGDALHFRFGDVLRFDGTITTQYHARRNEPLCAALSLTALAPVDGWLALSIQLIDATEAPIAAWDGTLGSHAPGERVTLTPCLDVPPDAPATLHLQLAVYDAGTFARLPVIEGGDARLYWGDRLVLGSVTLVE